MTDLRRTIIKMLNAGWWNGGRAESATVAELLRRRPGTAETAILAELAEFTRLGLLREAKAATERARVRG